PPTAIRGFRSAPAVPRRPPEGFRSTPRWRPSRTAAAPSPWRSKTGTSAKLATGTRASSPSRRTLRKSRRTSAHDPFFTNSDRFYRPCGAGLAGFRPDVGRGVDRNYLRDARAHELELGA